ncbi:MAG: branched-chain amino acid ABC transporter permease [Alphaproteobacteria bacterium]|nr:branched-chain amino acid ABC transporter permease [Alphaproteobacteria bacterium]
MAAAALSFCFPDFIVFRFTQAAIWAIALLGLVVLCGIGGQFSFAQAALFGIGGYTAAIVGGEGGGPASYAALILAPLAGYVVGYGAGRVACRHGIWTQALVTYALAIAFPQLLRWRLIESWTGGVQGLYLDAPAPPVHFLSQDRWIFLLALALLACGLALVHNVIASRSGRALMAARDDELAAAAQGIRVVHVRSVASGLAGALLAIAGCLAAFQMGFVGPTAYSFALSVQMLFGLVVGGMNAPAGAILGGLFLEFVPDVTAPLGKGLSAVLYAVLLIAAIVAMPKGIAGFIAALIAKRRLNRPWRRTRKPARPISDARP